ncbi:Uncharacterised protein [Legionella geestiana]|nr:Uncharacterised protein [Legionella geestiana]
MNFNAVSQKTFPEILFSTWTILFISLVFTFISPWLDTNLPMKKVSHIEILYFYWVYGFIYHVARLLKKFLRVSPDLQKKALD